MSPAKSPQLRVVVDGSNLATEGRVLPSLTQLDEAVIAFSEENPAAEIIVVADATFEHRVPAGERSRFTDAALAGEIVTPPAGAVGRGDAFILKIADRIGGVVLSNDSFQEFQDEYPWLFDVGRLIGGKPVRGVGWVFTPRVPVRNAKVTRASKKLSVTLANGEKPTIGTTITPVKQVKPKKAAVKKVAKAAEKPSEKTATKPEKAVERHEKPIERHEKPIEHHEKPVERHEKSTERPEKVSEKPVAKAPARAAKKAAKVTKVAKKGATKKAAKAAKTVKPPKKTVAVTSALTPLVAPTPAPAPAPAPAVALRRGRQPVNPEVDFAQFKNTYRVGAKVPGEVTAFTSHGAVIKVALKDDQQVECYAPTTSLGTPPPARARDVLKRGDQRTFRLVNVDSDRRIAELALA